MSPVSGVSCSGLGIWQLFDMPVKGLVSGRFCGTGSLGGDSRMRKEKVKVWENKIYFYFLRHPHHHNLLCVFQKSLSEVLSASPNALGPRAGPPQRAQHRPLCSCWLRSRGGVG